MLCRQEKNDNEGLAHPPWTRGYGRIMMALILVCVVAVLVFSVWTAPLGYVWHLFNRNSTPYHGWRIPVPIDFFVLRPTDNILTITRPEARLGFFDSPFAIITVGRLPEVLGPWDAERHYDEMNARVIQVEANAGYRFRGVSKRPVGDRTAYCWEFLGSGAKPIVEIRCRVDKEFLTIGYAGSQGYTDGFYSVLVSTVRESPSPQN